MSGKLCFVHEIYNVLNISVTSSAEWSLSCKADSCSAGPEVFCILWNLKVLHKILQRDLFFFLKPSPVYNLHSVLL